MGGLDLNFAVIGALREDADRGGGSNGERNRARSVIRVIRVIIITGFEGFWKG